MKNILVTIDDCETTTVASPIMERTLELASAFSSKVWILHIVPPPVNSLSNVDRNVLRREVAAEFRHEHEFLQQLAHCVREKGIDATALLVEGTIIRTILDESDRLDTDLIILGCQKHGPLFGALMGAAGEGLLSQCRRPIMSVPVRE